MGIVARCANLVLMSEEARLAMSGPEVIETASGVEEFDSRDRALVWRTTGGKHRYLMGDCQMLVADDIDAFRTAAEMAMANCAQNNTALTLDELETEQTMLASRLANYGSLTEPMAIWSAMGVAQPAQLAILEAEAFVALAAALPVASATAAATATAAMTTGVR
jgi:malonate decarboxylase beta subunit